MTPVCCPIFSEVQTCKSSEIQSKESSMTSQYFLSSGSHTSPDDGKCAMEFR